MKNAGHKHLINLKEEAFQVAVVPPGDNRIAEAIQSMVTNGGGYITCFSPPKVTQLQQMAGADSEAEVLEFGQLVTLVSRARNLKTGRLANPNQSIAAIAASCETLTEDSPFYRVRNFHGFHKKLHETIEEFWRLGWTGSDIEIAADRTSESVSRMLRDLAELDRKTYHFYEQFSLDRSVELIRQILATESKQSLPFNRVLVVASGERRPMWCEFLKYLATSGVIVQVFLEADGSEQFPDASLMAADLGVKLLKAESRAWWESLFDDSPIENFNMDVRIISAADKLAESEWIIRDCIERRANNVLPSKLVIFVRQIEEYAPLLEVSASRFGLELDLRRQAKINSSGLAQFALLLLRTADSDDVRAIGRFAQSSYLSLMPDQRESISAAATDSYRARDRAWESFRDWQMSREDLLTLGIFLDWRAKLHSSSLTFAAWRSRLIEVYEKMIPPPADRGAFQERDLRAKKAMERSLAEAAIPYDALNLPPLTLGQFADRCERLWDCNTFVTPAFGGVRVVSHPESIGTADTVYCLGVIEGSFPRRRSEHPIFDDHERDEIASAMPDMLPLENSFASAKREREFFLRVCASAASSLVFSYPRSSEERMFVRAHYLEQLQQSLGKKCQAITRRIDELAPEKLEDCTIPADQELREALELPRNPLSQAPQVYSRVVQEKIAERVLASTSPRVIARASLCEFWGGCSGPLDVSTKTFRTGWSALRHLPIAAQLVAQPDLESAKLAMNRSLDSILDDAYPYMNEGELRMLEETGQRFIDGWLFREFRCRELWGRDLKSVQINVYTENLPELLAQIRVSKEVAPIEIRDRIPAVFIESEHRVLLFYRGASPKLSAEFQSVIDETSLELFTYLTLLSARAVKVGVEIDSTSNERTLHYLSAGSFQFRKDAAKKLMAFRLQGNPESNEPDRESFNREVGKLIVTSAKALLRGELRAEPGSHCERCQFGELCRVHSEWGDKVKESELGEGEDSL